MREPSGARPPLRHLFARHPPVPDADRHRPLRRRLDGRGAGQAGRPSAAGAARHQPGHPAGGRAGGAALPGQGPQRALSGHGAAARRAARPQPVPGERAADRRGGDARRPHRVRRPPQPAGQRAALAAAPAAGAVPAAAAAAAAGRSRGAEDDDGRRGHGAGERAARDAGLAGGDRPPAGVGRVRRADRLHGPGPGDVRRPHAADGAGPGREPDHGDRAAARLQGASAAPLAGHPGGRRAGDRCRDRHRHRPAAGWRRGAGQAGAGQGSVGAAGRRGEADGRPRDADQPPERRGGLRPGRQVPRYHPGGGRPADRKRGGHPHLPPPGCARAREEAGSERGRQGRRRAPGGQRRGPDTRGRTGRRRRRASAASAARPPKKKKKRKKKSSDGLLAPTF